MTCGGNEKRKVAQDQGGAFCSLSRWPHHGALCHRGRHTRAKVRSSSTFRRTAGMSSQGGLIQAGLVHGWSQALPRLFGSVLQLK